MRDASNPLVNALRMEVVNVRSTKSVNKVLLREDAQLSASSRRYVEATDMRAWSDEPIRRVEAQTTNAAMKPAPSIETPIQPA